MSLGSARKTVENVFGIMSSRLRVFRTPLAVKRSTADEVVKACTVLHAQQVTKRLGILWGNHGWSRG